MLRENIKRAKEFDDKISLLEEQIEQLKRVYSQGDASELQLCVTQEYGETQFLFDCETIDIYAVLLRLLKNCEERKEELLKELEAL